MDCFLTRFTTYIAFIDRMIFCQCPNPVYWLEAEKGESDDESIEEIEASTFYVSERRKRRRQSHPGNGEEYYGASN